MDEFQTLVANLKNLGYSMSEKSLKEFSSFYAGQAYRIFKDSKKHKSSWGGTYNTYHNVVGFETGGSHYCCGQMEIGQFTHHPGEANEYLEGNDEDLKKVPANVWEALFRIMQLVEKDNGFAMTATLATPDYRTIETALRRCKFKKVKTVPSKHSKGKYDINIWQWIVKPPKVKK